MSDAVDFLEYMGQDARLRDASQADIEHAVAEAGLDPALQQAIVTRDKRRLEALLGAHHVCSVMIPGKEDDSEEERKDDEDDRQQNPSPETDVASSRSKLHVAA
jgi:hypothetical protein